MSTLKIPNGHQAIMPYLMLDGASKFSDFVIRVFGAIVTSTHYQPGSELIKHSEIQIGGSTVMFSDATKDWPAHPAHMFVYVENADDTYAKALKEGGTSMMELTDQDYGRSCGITDPCGNVWWITSVA